MRAPVADRPHQISRDRGYEKLVAHGVLRVIQQHDAGIVDQDVQCGMLGKQRRGGPRDAAGIGDVQLDRGHAGVAVKHRLQPVLAAARDDDLVASLVESLSEGAADARAAAGDEDRVAGHAHDDVLGGEKFGECG